MDLSWFWNSPLDALECDIGHYGLFYRDLSQLFTFLYIPLGSECAHVINVNSKLYAPNVDPCRGETDSIALCKYSSNSRYRYSACVNKRLISVLLCYFVLNDNSRLCHSFSSECTLWNSWNINDPH
jgi:hypothetical protein